MSLSLRNATCYNTHGNFTAVRTALHPPCETLHQTRKPQAMSLHPTATRNKGSSFNNTYLEPIIRHTPEARPVIRTSAAQSRLPAKVTLVPRNVQETQAQFENEFHKQRTYNGHNVPRHSRVFPWKYRRCTRDIRHTRRKKGRQSFIE